MANPLGVVAMLTQSASTTFKKLDKLIKAGSFHRVANQFLN